MFENIIGNERNKQLLMNMFETGKLVNSYLFVGPDGVGKYIFAKEFIKQIPEYFEINKDGEAIKVEDIRDMNRQIIVKPIVSDKKLFIINNADMMTENAQNAFLKTLEEPPTYAIIILITSNENKLLTTIKSRVMKLEFDKLKDDEIEKYVREELEIIPTKNMIKNCNGSFGNAQKLKELGDDYKALEELIDNISKKDQLYILNTADFLYEKKGNKTIEDLLNYMNIVLFEKKWYNCVQYVEEARNAFLGNANFDMTIDKLLIDIWEEIN